MTQLSEAVGDATNDTVVAAEPTITDRFSAIAEDQDDLPEEDRQDDASASADVELAPEDVAELEADAEESDASPIQAPVSWTAEEKEEFNNLPRTLQETLTRREGEREKFVQAKAQEAKQTRSAVEQQAFGIIKQLQDNHIQHITSMLPAIPERPNARLQAEDPYAYADQLDAHEWALAQHQQAQQVIQAIEHQQAQHKTSSQEQARRESFEILQEKFPEYLDATKGPELKKALQSTALALGYSQDQLANTDAQDVLAIKTASEWKAKADKLDTLMAKKMERVREAKSLPRVSRPGTPQKGVVANERYQADRSAMRGGDRDAGARVFSKFI